MKYAKIYRITIKELEKIKKQDDRVSNLFLLICLLIWRFSLYGLHLDTTLKMINEFDYFKNFNEEEEKDGKTN